MGITHFTKWIECFDEEGEQWNEPFDSVWIDLQSEIYVAIDLCFPLNDRYDARCESEFFRDVSAAVQKRLAGILLEVFTQYPRQAAEASDDEEEEEQTTLVLCAFDGRGVPMKWPTQRKRRSANVEAAAAAAAAAAAEALLRGKQAYRASLFGRNALATRVCRDLVRDLSTGRFHDVLFAAALPLKAHFFPKNLRYLVSGCDVPGEGEHKIFHAAERLRVRYPLFVSVDNDAFQLGFARLRKFECVQLYNRRKLYNLTHFVREVSACPAVALLYTSLLFGNDFLPPLLTLSDANCTIARRAMSEAWEHAAAAAAAAVGGRQSGGRGEDDEEGWPSRRLMPAFYARFLTEMGDALRYERLPARTPLQVDRLASRFWTTCFWVLDYYTLREFPQKWRQRNELFDAFDRDALLALVLGNPERSAETFERARGVYESSSSTTTTTTTTTTDDDGSEPPASEANRAGGGEMLLRDHEAVFDPDALRVIERFFRLPDGDGAGLCHDIKIATRKRKKGARLDAVETTPMENKTNGIRRRWCRGPLDTSSAYPN